MQNNKEISQEYRAFLQGKVVSICEAIIDETMGIVAGSRILNRLGYDLYEQLHEDFIYFVGIDSESDHLPVDSDRRNWNIEALKNKDIEISKFESKIRDEVNKKCRQTIIKYKINNNI